MQLPRECQQNQSVETPLHFDSRRKYKIQGMNSFPREGSQLIFQSQSKLFLHVVISHCELDLVRGYSSSLSRWLDGPYFTMATWRLPGALGKRGQSQTKGHIQIGLGFLVSVMCRMNEVKVMVPRAQGRSQFPLSQTGQTAEEFPSLSANWFSSIDNKTLLFPPSLLKASFYVNSTCLVEFGSGYCLEKIRSGYCQEKTQKTIG